MLHTSLSTMEASLLEEVLKSKGNDCRYIDVPEFITNIKQEIVNEPECTEFINGVKIKEEPPSKFEEQLGTNPLLLNHVKTEPIESKETVDGYNFTEDKFSREINANSATVKMGESCEDNVEGFISLKPEEVDIKVEVGGSSEASADDGRANKSKIPKRGLIHRCTECNYCTPRKNHLRSHMLHHGNLLEDTMFQCHQCEYKSSYRGNFKRHVQKCKPWKLKFKTSDKIMLLKCSDCEYQTLDYRNLSRHVLRHKSVSEVEMHKCNQCEYQTKYKSNMNMHVRRHARREQLEILKCPECEYQTFDKNNLDLHILRHRSAENGKSHKCSVCGYITLKKSHLNIHVLRHKDSTEVDMFQCPLCSYQAIRRSDLNRHIIRHESGKDKKYPNSSIGVMKRLTRLN